MNTPAILVLDDLFGRSCHAFPNRDRENLCAHLLLRDITGDEAAEASSLRIAEASADAVFGRAQKPIMAMPGDTVENSLSAALELARRGWPLREPVYAKPGTSFRWAMVLLDLCFSTGIVTEESHRRAPGMPEGRPSDDDPSSYFGLAVLDAIHREMPDLPVVILSSRPREEVAFEFSARGAVGFIARDDPRGPDLLREMLWQHGLLTDPSEEIIGRSLSVLLALRSARQAARHRENLLITGERGVGKELLAKYVHEASRADSESPGARPFVRVNSALFSPGLFAAELFGVESRVASGVDAKVGLIERAQGGDLFLDEIADMASETQAGILRVLQERQVTRVGGHQPKRVDVRFLSASNSDLEAPSSPFRRDLLDRLQIGGSLVLPPLRERREDISLLVEKFLRQVESQRRGAVRRMVSPEAIEHLERYHWPGNVRELRSVVFEAVTRFPGVEHLVEHHLRLAGQSRWKAKEAVGELSASQPRTRSPSPSVSSFDSLLASLSGARFDTATTTEWAGRLPELQRSQQRTVARLLLAALEATKRRSPERPEGIVQIHPAMKLLTGDTNLSASAAADAIKRLLKPIEDELEGDLRAAYDVATRLRPKSPTTARRVANRKGG